MQMVLKSEQIETFYHDQFVQQQVEHFERISLRNSESNRVNRVIVDVGGGVRVFRERNCQGIQSACSSH